MCQALSASFVFYGGAAPLAFFLTPEMARIPFLLFTLLVPASFAVLTRFWYERSSRNGNVPRPEFNLMIGLVVLMPVYFEFASLLFYKPRPIVGREVLRHLFWYYAMFPVTLTLLAGYTATLGGLILSFVSILITGNKVRKRIAFI
jgi:hypothetical protein